MQIKDQSDPNTGEPWSEIDLFDLANCVWLRQSVEEIADFLCRPFSEVYDKIMVLQRTGELQRRIAEAAAGAKD